MRRKQQQQWPGMGLKCPLAPVPGRFFDPQRLRSRCLLFRVLAQNLFCQVLTDGINADVAMTLGHGSTIMQTSPALEQSVHFQAGTCGIQQSIGVGRQYAPKGTIDFA